MVCGIDSTGLDILFFLIHRRVSWEQFEKIWSKKTPDLENKIRDLEKRKLVIRTRDGRRKIIAMLDNAQCVKILLNHDKIPPAHHRHPTRLKVS